jgi:hypothetical protein
MKVGTLHDLDGAAPQSPGPASRCLRPRCKHRRTVVRRTVVVQIETVCPSWLFIKVSQKYASEPCDINGVKTVLEPREGWIIF